MNTENTQPAADANYSYLLELLVSMDGAANHDSLIEFEEVDPQDIERAVAAGLVQLFEVDGERGVHLTSRGAELAEDN